MCRSAENNEAPTVARACRHPTCSCMYGMGPTQYSNIRPFQAGVHIVIHPAAHIPMLVRRSGLRAACRPASAVLFRVASPIYTPNSLFTVLRRSLEPRVPHQAESIRGGVWSLFIYKKRRMQQHSMHHAPPARPTSHSPTLPTTAYKNTATA